MRTVFALATLVLVLLASACGGGGDDRLSAAELRKQADQICKEGDEEIGKIPEPESAAELGSYFDKAIPVFRDQTEQLEALEPPEELEKDWNRAMELNQKSLQIAEDAQQAAEDKDERALQETIEQGQANEAELDKLARKMGLKVCSDDST